MTLQRYIMNLLKNYHDANVREYELTGKKDFNDCATRAQQLYDKLEQGHHKDEIDLYDISQLKKHGEENSREALASLDMLLDMYFNNAKDEYTSETNAQADPDLKMPRYNYHIIPVDDFEILPSVGKWHSAKGKTYDEYNAALKTEHKERLEKRNLDIAEAVEQLAASAKKTWGGSPQYREFQETMIELNDTLQHPEKHPNADVDFLFKTALDQAQAYLNFKANDHKINKRGRERTAMVNKMLHKLAQYDFAMQADTRVYSRYGLAESKAEDKQLERAENQRLEKLAKQQKQKAAQQPAKEKPVKMSIADVKFPAENVTLKELDKQLNETYKQLQEVELNRLLDAHDRQIAVDAIQYAAMKRFILNDLSRYPDEPEESFLFQYTEGCTFQDFKNSFAKFDEFNKNPDVLKPNYDSALAYVQDMSNDGRQNQMAKAVGKKIKQQMVQMNKPKELKLSISKAQGGMTLGNGTH